MIKNPPLNAGNADSILVGSEIPYATGQLSPSAATRESLGAAAKPSADQKRKKTEKEKDFHMIVTECLSKWEKLLKS